MIVAAPDPAPRELRPMLATSGPVPRGPGWAFEFRWDGLRSIAHVERGRVRLLSAAEREISAAYPELAVLGERVGRRGAVLDGKIVALDSYGRPSLEPLRRRMNQTRPSRRLVEAVPVAYYVFDVLHADGRSLLGAPYRERRERLAGLDLAAGRIVVPPSFADTTGRVVVDTAQTYGLDGVVAKRLDSLYRPGQRSRSWVETTLRQRIEVLVGGWVPGSGGAAAGPVALLVGLPTERGLSFAGRVRSGLDAVARRELAAALPALATAESLFVEDLPPAAVRGVRWVQPRLVGEVGFRRWSSEGRLAYPSWLRLRPDAHPAVVRPAVVLGGETGAPGGEPSSETGGETDGPVGGTAAAELRALREQISPHFVYNALNTVASLVRTDPARARDLLTDFAGFTRYAFGSAAELAPLGDELDAVGQYLALEHARFGARLRSELRIAPEVGTVQVPFLAVQSLVVDAVRQGIEPTPTGGTLTLCAELGDSRCVVRITDTGVERPRDVVHDVAERLTAAFGRRADVRVRRAGDATTVTLRLPR